MDYMPPRPKAPIIPALPQNETPENAEKRKAALAATKKLYTLTKTNPLGIPILTAMPEDAEKFSDTYTFGRAVATVPLVANVATASKQVQPASAFAPAEGIATFESYYPSYPKPSVINDWLTDESFGEQRLSGVNPVTLELVTRLPENFDIKQVKSALKDVGQLDTLITNKALYMVDYTKVLANVKGGQVNVFGIKDPIKKFMPKPIALFEWHSDPDNKNDPSQKTGRLLPVAIQIDINNDGGYKVFTPNSAPLLWGIAKICFSCADSNVHEMVTHLGRAHFAQESFGAVTPMQLAPEHPLHILLKPHLRFMVYNNAAGLTELIQKDGPVDFLLAGTLAESTGMSVQAAKEWSIKDTLPLSLKARGVDDKTLLPHYPYRDDGLLVWNAIEQYVREYLGIYYKEAAVLKDDFELQAWAAALASTEDDGGNILDMPCSIACLDQLTEILTQIIFEASAGHSAVNFTQYPYLGFSPNAPLAGYADYQAFLSQEDTSDQEQLDFYLKFLPPPVMAIGQINITGALSAYHFDELGDYQAEFEDGLARHTLYRFSQNLQKIEEEINARNRSRVTDYKFMKPSEILNSASI